MFVLFYYLIIEFVGELPVYFLPIVVVPVCMHRYRHTLLAAGVANWHKFFLLRANAVLLLNYCQLCDSARAVPCPPRTNT